MAGRNATRAEHDRRKMRAAQVSIASSTTLMLGKLAIGFHMGSVSVISDGIHSSLDLLAALIAFTAVRKAAQPADLTHRYGHGKFENLAGMAEGLLILGAAVAIVWNAVPRFVNPVPVEALGLGAAIVGVAIVFNFLVSEYVMRVARETDSPALKADAWHLRSDVYTSVGVLIGLGLIKVTGLLIFDPLVAIIVSLIIVRAAYHLIRDAARSLLDVRLSEDDEEQIRAVLDRYRPEFVEYHTLRTRKAGSERHIDLHLVMAADIPVAEAHHICECLEREIINIFPNAQVLIRIEPCSGECLACSQAGACRYCR